MVDRILLTSSGLKVSKPGFDVNTAALQNLAFDTDNLGIQPFWTALITTHTPVAYPSPGFIPVMVYQFKRSGLDWAQGFSTVGGLAPPTIDASNVTCARIQFISGLQYRVSLFNVRAY